MLTVSFLFGCLSELAPMIVVAKEQHEQQQVLIDQMVDTIKQDVNGHYSVDFVKVEQYHLQQRINDLLQIATIANAEEPKTNAIEVTPFILGELTIAKVISELTLAALDWIIKQILETGLFTACSRNGMYAYRLSLAGVKNPGSYYFYALCRARGFM